MKRRAPFAVVALVLTSTFGEVGWAQTGPAEAATPDPAPAEAATPEPATPGEPGVLAEEPTEIAPSSRRQAQLVIGGVALGVGLTAIAAGAVVGIVAAAKYAALDCPDGQCPPELTDDAESYNDLRLPSGTTIFLGSMLAVTGTILLIDHASQGDVALRLGPGAIGIEGRF